MIERLLITNLRVLSQVQLNTLSHCNLFIGKNGSGKTSLLEAIYLLSRGKSFRHHQPRHYIQYSEDSATVFASIVDNTPKDNNANPYARLATTMAVAKLLDGTSKLKLNAVPVNNQSELTRRLAVILLDPTELNLLDHGSGERRGLLDWLVFHTMPTFYKTWLSYQRALKQRNRLLKTYQESGVLHNAVCIQISAFDEQLASLGEDIHQMRASIIEKWQPIFFAVCQKLLPQYTDMSMRYSPGFDTQVGFKTVLTERIQKDTELGYTRVGVHRADVMIYVGLEAGKKHAADVFSRGEKKLLIMALKLSQIQLLSAFGKQSVVLLDDINAELDEAATLRLLQGLHACQSQLFITSLEKNITSIMTTIWDDDVAIFSVDSGIISPI